MKYKLIILIFTIATLSIASCGTDEEDVTPTPPVEIEEGAGDGKAILLKEMVSYSDGKISYISRYKYDTQNRLVLQEDIQIDGSVSYSIEFIYDSEGRLGRLKNIERDGSYDITTFTYTGNTVTNGYNTYKLSDDNRVISKEEYNGTTYRYFYDGESRLSAIDILIPDNKTSNVDFQPLVEFLKYDSNNHPFKNVSVKQLLFVPYLHTTFENTYMNNVEISQDSNGNIWYSSYEINDYGFPISYIGNTSYPYTTKLYYYNE